MSQSASSVSNGGRGSPASTGSASSGASGAAKVAKKVDRFIRVEIDGVIVEGPASAFANIRTIHIVSK